MVFKLKYLDCVEIKSSFLYMHEVSSHYMGMRDVMATEIAFANWSLANPSVPKIYVMFFQE